MYYTIFYCNILYYIVLLCCIMYCYIILHCTLLSYLQQYDILSDYITFCNILFYHIRLYYDIYYVPFLIGRPASINGLFPMAMLNSQRVLFLAHLYHAVGWFSCGTWKTSLHGYACASRVCALRARADSASCHEVPGFRRLTQGDSTKM